MTIVGHIDHFVLNYKDQGHEHVGTFQQGQAQIKNHAAAESQTRQRSCNSSTTSLS